MRSGFSIIELLVVVTIVGVIAAIGIPVYKTYSYRAQIMAMIRETAQLQTWILQQHAAGAVYGATVPNSGNLSFVCNFDQCTTPTFPANIRQLNYGWYGCVQVEPNLMAMGLEPNLTNRLAIELCPQDNSQNNSGLITWTCGYIPGLGASQTEISYLPSNCQQSWNPDLNF